LRSLPSRKTCKSVPAKDISHPASKKAGAKIGRLEIPINSRFSFRPSGAAVGLRTGGKGLKTGLIKTQPQPVSGARIS
jgi:hypothetical protein